MAETVGIQGSGGGGSGVGVVESGGSNAGGEVGGDEAVERESRPGRSGWLMSDRLRWRAMGGHARHAGLSWLESSPGDMALERCALRDGVDLSRYPIEHPFCHFTCRQRKSIAPLARCCGHKIGACRGTH